MSARRPRRATTASLARRALLAMSSLFAVGRARAQTATPAAGREGFVMPPGRAPRYAGPQGRERDLTELLATSGQTGGAFGLFRQTIAPGSGPPAHLHRAEDEFIYVVSGEFDVLLGGRVERAPAQSVVFVPRATAHTFRNVGAEPGVLLVGVAPGGLEMLFAEWQGADAATARALWEKHNVTFVGPPLR